jgi:ABC-2 type transport system ATP-binding protein
MLSIRDTTKRFGTLTALDSVSLDVREGECLGLLGPNGAGKSTLMSLISGIKQADSGTLSLGGMPIGPNEDGPRRILGLVPQSIALYPELTAQQNLRIFGELAGLSGSLLRERIDEALVAVQLQDRRNDHVKTFSGGMQRRLNLVASLLHRPKLLLCDEPTVGVDPQSRNAIFEFLARLRAEGMTLVYSTHYMAEAERLCSRIAIIDHGKILALGTLDELLAKLPFEDEIRFPANADTARLLPLLEGKGEWVSTPGEHRFRPAPGLPLSAFHLAAEGLGLPSRLFVVQRPTLENVFLHLTGRTLRE